MNKEIIDNICLELNIKEYQVNNTLKLLSEGATIPFIARYRKEATGSLDENEINKINEVYTYQVNLLKRKEDVIRLIEEKGLMTDELKENILKCNKLIDVEDLYRPFKEKKKTKASLAISLGLEPLAKEIFRENIDIDKEALKYINDKIKDINYALEQALYIVAEDISDNAKFRGYIRDNMQKFGIIKTTKKKNSIDKDKIYELYYNYEEKIKYIKPHKILAINRGEKENILNVSIDNNMEYIENYLKQKLIHKNNKASSLLELGIKDALKRLIMPSIEREIRSELTDIAEDKAIVNFSNNLKNLLMMPPIKDKTVLGFDPAFRTGCKLAVISPTGELLHIDVIYPHEPINKKEEAKEKVLDLIDKYQDKDILTANDILLANLYGHIILNLNDTFVENVEQNFLRIKRDLFKPYFYCRKHEEWNRYIAKAIYYTIILYDINYPNKEKCHQLISNFLEMKKGLRHYLDDHIDQFIKDMEEQINKI